MYHPLRAATPVLILYIISLVIFFFFFFLLIMLIASKGVFIPACFLPDKEKRPELDAHCLITWDILMARQKMVKYY